MCVCNEDCYRAVGSSVHRNSNGSGGDPVSDDNKLARAQFLGCWHIEMSRYETVECDGHAAVVVGPAIEYVSSCVVGDAHERIVCCRLLIVAVSSPLRHAVEKVTGDDIRPAGVHRGRGRLDLGPARETLARGCRAFVPHDIYSRKRRRAKGSASVKRFLRQFPARKAVSVMRVRYALRCDWSSLERKRHRRIRTADTKIMETAQSGLLMRILATESGLLRERMKS
jgi:hypothetical protein